MTATIGTLLAAHAAGKPLTATLEETYARIEKHNDPALFIATRAKPEALAIAERVQASGPEGKPLYGVPFVVKDNIDVAGLATTAACPAFAYRPGKSAFVVERLERAGAIVIGKTNLDQFATGLVGVRSPTGFHATRCALISYPADQAPVRRRRSAPASFRFRSAPTRRDRGACRRRSTESWA